MNQTFEYFYVSTAMDSIDVHDVGNCIIEATTDTNKAYYLVIKTLLGVTRILEYGPFIDGGFPKELVETFSQMDYDEKKICKRIERFLRRPEITQVQQIEDFSIIENKLKNPIEYLLF